MASASQIDHLQAYTRRVRQARRANPAVSEPGLAPLFNRLLTDLLPTLSAAPALTVLAEYEKGGVGRPDLALARPGEAARAFLELKSPDKPSDGAKWKGDHDRRQFARFGEFADWATCNFHEIRRYERREDRGYAALVPLAALDPSRSDAAAEALVAAHDPDAALRLLERLAQAQAPQAKDAEALATLLAHAGRLVAGTVRDRLAELAGEGSTATPLQQVRQEFRDVLYSHPEAAGYAVADFDDLFAGAFAQTLAFGLLLVREASGAAVDRHAADHMPRGHPLMKTALGVLSQEAVAREIGTAFDVMLDTVNSGLSNPAILAVQANGRDPILHFYEDFLKTFDPAARERFGVYYTPVQVVRFMVGALDRALRERLGTGGIADEAVHILDPATGTGTFLLGVAEHLRRTAEAADGPGQVAPALRGLAARMYGFELLVGPYAVAHFRLNHTLSRPAIDGGASIALPRLGVYLADTLAQPDAPHVTSRLGFFGEGIENERRDAERIRSRQPILAIIGNPPYRRLEVGEDESLVGRWMNGLWSDLKRPVSEAGWGNQLNTFPELSVAFWRWAMWKLFEADGAPKRGVVAFITNRKFLTGRPYAGLRKMMRERFDRIEVIDLRGDSRLGERAGVEGDQNVFNIQVGVAITIAVADGSRAEGAPAALAYTDAWQAEAITRAAKLRWLDDGAAAAVEVAEPVDRPLLDDMKPVPFLNGSLLSLREAFAYSRGGVQTKRDDFIYAARFEDLKTRIEGFVSAGNDVAEKQFRSTSENGWQEAKAVPFSQSFIEKVSYRPFDRRFIYNHPAMAPTCAPNFRPYGVRRTWRSTPCHSARGGGRRCGATASCPTTTPSAAATAATPSRCTTGDRTMGR